ncbi:MAG: class I SAM-dependent methyltransferase family protein [Candidatus Diapherotrites archaeon]|nr:class I SAM-dependent methyltransferase family protein [Candidatus Diapherotrites archaeon]
MKAKYIKVEKKKAEKIRKHLIDNNLKEHGFPVKITEKHVFFPVKKEVCENKGKTNSLKKIAEFEITELEAEKIQRKPKSLKEALSTKLSKEELSNLTTSFDIVGDIAVVDIPKTLLDKKKTIAEAVLSVQKGVKTVAMRTGIFSGEFRVRPIKVIAGENTTISSYKEHGSVMDVDLSKMYFSPRLSNERKRISKQVKEGEDVAVLFAGVGPFALAICRHQPKVNKIVAVELNKEAVKYMEQNIKKNNFESKITPVLGDAKKPKELGLSKKFDRVLMPLPKGAYMFLDEAIECLKKNGGMIHFYHFAHENDLFSEAEQIITDAAQRNGFKATIIFRQKVRPYAPHVFQIVIDAQLSPKN